MTGRPPQPGSGGLGGAIGGGMLGGLVGAGLDGLIDAFRRSGHGDVIDSWVGRGHNRQIAPNELGNVLGDDTVSVLEQQTGLPRAQLLSELSDTLPEVIDQLTPEGRTPDDDEARRDGEGPPHMSHVSESGPARVSVPQLQTWKDDGRRFVMVTAYDAATARSPTRSSTSSWSATASATSAWVSTRRCRSAWR